MLYLWLYAIFLIKRKNKKKKSEKENIEKLRLSLFILL